MAKYCRVFLSENLVGGDKIPPPLGVSSGGGKISPIFGGGESAILQIYMMKTLIMTYYML